MKRKHAKFVAAVAVSVVVSAAAAANARRVILVTSAGVVAVSVVPGVMARVRRENWNHVPG